MTEVETDAVPEQIGRPASSYRGARRNLVRNMSRKLPDDAEAAAKLKPRKSQLRNWRNSQSRMPQLKLIYYENHGKTYPYVSGRRYPRHKSVGNYFRISREITIATVEPRHEPSVIRTFGKHLRVRT